MVCHFFVMLTNKIKNPCAGQTYICNYERNQNLGSKNTLSPLLEFLFTVPRLFLYCNSSFFNS